jgi:hypothetical protein
MGFIGEEELGNLAKALSPSEYGDYLQKLIRLFV